MEITKIEKTKRGRYSLFIDGEFAFSVFPDQLFLTGLKKGSKITMEKKNEIYENSQQYFAKDKAMKLLSMRNYTRYELSNKLKDLANEKIVNEICDKMEQVGLLNDIDYAQRRASDLYKFKKFGQYRVFRDLQNKGIEKEMAEEISLEFEPEDKIDILFDLISKKHRRKFENIVDAKNYYKIISSVSNSLIRLGYNYEDVKIAINKYVLENNINY